VSGTGGFGEFLPDLEAAFAEVASSALGRPEAVTAQRLEDPPPRYQGAYLGIVAAQGALQIGLASDEAGCQALAKGLMGMADGEPDLPTGEMADAFCEIVNIVAGGFKARIRDRAGALQLGLPVFFRGPAQPTEHTAVKVAMVALGPVSAALLLVFPRGVQG
jgi:Chemotaxis phosphatase CheX